MTATATVMARAGPAIHRSRADGDRFGLAAASWVAAVRELNVTDMGCDTAWYVAAYAARQGTDEATYTDDLGPALTPDNAGQPIGDLVTGHAHDQDPSL